MNKKIKSIPYASPKLKAEVAILAISEQIDPSELCETYGISKETLWCWVNTLKSNAAELFEENPLPKTFISKTGSPNIKSPLQTNATTSSKNIEHIYQEQIDALEELKTKLFSQKQLLDQNIKDEILYHKELIKNNTLLKNQHDAVSKIEALLKGALEHSHIGICLMEAENQTITLINSIACNILGFPKEEIEGISIDAFFHKLEPLINSDKKASTLEQMPLYKAAKELKIIENVEMTLLGQNGKETSLLINAAPIFDTNNECIASIATFLDISARKQLEIELDSSNQILTIQNEELLENEQNLLKQNEELKKLNKKLRLAESTIKASSIATFWFTSSASLIQLNEAACDLLNYSNNDICNLQLQNIIAYFKNNDWQTFWNNLLKEKTIRLESEAFCLHKPPCPIEMKIDLFDFNGELLAVAFVEDIHHRKKLEKELDIERRNLEKTVEIRTKELHNSLKQLKISNLQLEEANQHKGKFLSSMSHELRTPLNAIIGFADLLKRQYYGPLNEQQLDYIKLIDKSGIHLLDLINDILDIAKVDAGSMDLQREEILPQLILKEMYSLMQNQFKSKEIEFTCILEESLPSCLADKRKLMQIILNLLSNAYKFTQKNGKVTLKAEEYQNYIKFSVSDTGCGISPINTEKIFEEFYQVSQTASQETISRGTGIGLALTKRLVELHNGEIGLNSTIKKGSTFWFTIPKTSTLSKKIDSTQM